MCLTCDLNIRSVCNCEPIIDCNRFDRIFVILFFMKFKGCLYPQVSSGLNKLGCPQRELSGIPLG